METLRNKLREFNSLSRDTDRHFKLCVYKTNRGPRHEVRLCSSHPRFITCTADTTRIHVRSTGPSSVRLSLPHEAQSLHTLLKLLHEHREDSDTLLDWEMEDWVSAGYPCKMHSRQEQGYFPDLGFTPEDLWCIDEQPNRPAFI